MRTNDELISPSKALLNQWCGLWAMAYLFAKTMTLAQYRDPRRAIEKAEMLGVWSRFALFTLIGQIGALESRSAPLSKQDKTSLAHCRAIVGALAMLCVLAAKVKRECFERVGVVSLAPLHEIEDYQASSAKPITAIGYLDSS